MKKKLLYSLLFGMFAAPGVFGADYGLPTEIQQGNILHCFNWKLSDIKAELPNIAAAGFGSVQVSPLQRNVAVGENWSAAYRPYDFKFIASAGLGSAEDLKSLCQEAEKYGIKIIVDVVENHVDGWAAGDRNAYHDPWWNSNGRLRWYGSVNNWGDRGQITTHQMGGGNGYPDVNSEDSEVAARGKAYIQELKDMGVKGIRFDAAKHIGLPSEGCQFWATVTSVPGLYYYGEILDGPGGDGDRLMKEYTTYIAVTDNNYGDQATKNNGIPNGHAGWCAGTIDANKTVYWGESHDTYANDDGFSKNLSQDQVDRGYAIVACRNGETALYLSRPSAKNFNDIKIGVKGSTAYKNKHIAEVNKFRNVMVGKADYYSGGNGVASVTRKDGGAVIVANGGNRNISVANGGGYCPAGTYTDRVSGATFTVTASTISGNVGPTGIAVIYNDGITPNPPTPPTPVDGKMWILGNIDGHQWTTTSGAEMTLTDGKYVANGVKLSAAAGETTCYFNITDALGADWDELNMVANRYGAATEGASITLGTPATVVKYANGVDASGCLSWKVAAGTYDFAFDPSAMTLTLVNAGDNPNPNPNPDPNPTPDPTPGEEHYIYFDGTSFTQPMVYAWIDDDNRVSAAWGGDNMVKKDGKWYWEVPEGKDVPKMVIIHEGDNKIGAGDLTYVDKATYHQDGTYTLSGGDDPNPPTPPTPASGDMFILGNLSVGHWNPSKGVAMTAEGSVYSAKDVVLEKPATDDKAFFTFVTKLGTSATDWDAVNASDRYGASTKDEAITAGSTVTVVKYPVNVSASSAYSWAIAPGTYDITFDTSSMKMTVVNAGNDPTPVKPVVTASPASGTTFTESLSVTLTVSPAADIYYTLDGSAATTSSTKYSAPISISETTTISTLAVTADGAENAQKFSYTKRSNDDPNPPTPSGNNLITNYYKVNPNGQCGTFKTVNMTGHPATNAFSNWGPEDLIAQGVARDVCQAFKGVHERPIVDSYAVYAAYDNDNLYLGIQFVYAIWDLGGEGKQPGESKPYNMDGHMCLAFDLDPNKSFDGYISGAGPVWNDQAKGAKFANGVDAVIMCSTKPGVGTPGLFLATPDGHASYSAEYCKELPAGFWGHIDGLHPSIDHVWGQADFSYDPELLKGNEGFVDLRSEIDDDAHTFYEFKLPLSSLGITADQIRNQGIGFMYLDKYGTSPVGGTPYDPSFFDNVNGSYSQDVSSSQEKEDEDVITYAPARIGKMGITTGVELPVVDEAVMDVDPIYFTLQGVRVENPSNGLYIVVRGNKVTKEFVR